MKEIIFQDITANSRKKRLLSMEEVFEHDSYTYSAVRKTIFRVKERFVFKDARMAHQWILKRLNDPNQPKHLSVLRISNREGSQSLWRIRLVGTFYIIRDNIGFSVLFLQVYKIGINRRG